MFDTQDGKILWHMCLFSTNWFITADYCGNGTTNVFIGYKAAARLGFMKKAGTIIGRWSDRRSQTGARYKEYRLNHEMYEFKFDEIDKAISRRLRDKPLTESQVLKLYK